MAFRSVQFATLILAGSLAGCTAFDDHRATLEGLYERGDFEGAAAVLDDPKLRRLYGAQDELLWKLDRGAVALAVGDGDTAIGLLEEAEREIEVNREAAAGDVAAQWLVNDGSAKYIAEPYEDIYVNVLKLLAQLESGRIAGGATVEARRLGSKADRLRDQYLKYEEALESKGSARLGSLRSGGPVRAVNSDGRFVESTLGTYLAAVAFMKSGDRELQRVAGRRLVDSIRLQSGLIGPVREEDFAGLGEMSPEEANVLVVALSGRGPTKYAEKVGPVPLGTFPVYFELPRLRVEPSEAAAARIEVDGAPAAHAALVEDLGAVATENHERMLPLIYGRTLLRYAIKAGISTAVTEAARRSASDQDQGLVQVAGVIAGLAVLMATERADLRAWIFLPGEARVSLLNLPPGEHRVRVVYEDASGGEVYATPWRSVTVDTGLASVITQYWR